MLRKQFELVRRELARCLWTEEVSDEFGATKAALERRGNQLDDFDTAIDAHALALGAVLVTANLGHLTRGPGLAVEDCAAPARHPAGEVEGGDHPNEVARLERDIS